MRLDVNVLLRITYRSPMDIKETHKCNMYIVQPFI